MLIVNAQSAADIDVIDVDVMLFELLLQVVDTVAEGFEIAHIEYL